jgi:hypothetical protein
MEQHGMHRTQQWPGQHIYEHALSRTIHELNVTTLPRLPTKVIPRVHVLAPSSCHVVFARSNAALVVLKNGDGGAGVLMKHVQLKLKLFTTIP